MLLRLVPVPCSHVEWHTATRGQHHPSLLVHKVKAKRHLTFRTTHLSIKHTRRAWSFPNLVLNA